MIYTNLTRKAMNIMYDAHKNQVDKSGVPYVFHPILVAEKMNSEDTTIVALLHDVVEDCDISIDDLSFFGEDIVEAISLLTRDKKEDYFTYIKKIALNTIARKVKIEDLRHNSDLSRLEKVSDKDLRRRDKYLKSLNYLEAIDKEFSKTHLLEKKRKFA